MVYDPNAGIWLSRDPSGEDGGLNLEEAFNDDPINFSDPTGLAPESTQPAATQPTSQPTASFPLEWHNDRFAGVSLNAHTFDLNNPSLAHVEVSMNVKRDALTTDLITRWNDPQTQKQGTKTIRIKPIDSNQEMPFIDPNLRLLFTNGYGRASQGDNLAAFILRDFRNDAGQLNEIPATQSQPLVTDSWNAVDNPKGANDQSAIVGEVASDPLTIYLGKKSATGVFKTWLYYAQINNMGPNVLQQINIQWSWDPAGGKFNYQIEGGRVSLLPHFSWTDWVAGGLNENKTEVRE